MKTFFKFSCIILILCSLAVGCALADCMEKNGEITSQNYPVTELHSLNIGSVFDVFLTDSLQGQVRVLAPKKLLPFIEVKEQNGQLSVDFPRGNPCKIPIVFVPAQNLNTLKLSGAARLSSEKPIETEHFHLSVSGVAQVQILIRTERLRAEVSGAGRLFLIGRATQSKIDCSGAGDFSGQNFSTQSADIDVSGTASLKINCTNSIKAKASGASHISIYGKPKSTEISSSGVANISLDD